MKNNGIKIRLRSGTRLVATGVIRRAKGSQKGQGEIRGQKGNPSQVRTKRTRYQQGPVSGPEDRGATLRLHGRSLEAEQWAWSQKGPGVLKGMGWDRRGEGRSGHGLVRMSVGSGKLKARLFGSTGVRVRVWDGLG